jgi:hypothetical protein
VKLVAEAPPGNLVEQEVGTIEREDSINPATLGLTIAEGKAIMPATRGRGGPGSTPRGQYQVLFAMWQVVSHQGLLPVHSAQRLWQGPDAGSTHQGMSLHGISGAQLFDDLHEQVSDHTGVALPHCQNGRLVAVWQSYRVFE